jgi:hypothetical protein
MGRKLYVGNLGYGVTDSDRSKMFEAHGTVESAQVIMDRDTGRSKGLSPHQSGSYNTEHLICPVLKGTVPMPKSTSTSRIIIIGGSPTHRISQTSQRSPAMQHRSAPRRIVVIRNGKYTPSDERGGSEREVGTRELRPIG